MSDKRVSPTRPRLKSNRAVHGIDDQLALGSLTEVGQGKVDCSLHRPSVTRQSVFPKAEVPSLPRAMRHLPANASASPFVLKNFLDPPSLVRASTFQAFSRGENWMTGHFLRLTLTFGPSWSSAPCAPASFLIGSLLAVRQFFSVC